LATWKFARTQFEDVKIRSTNFRQSTLAFHNPRRHTAIMATTQGAISKRRKFVADGVFYAELNEFFQRELAEEGYSGVEVRVTPTVTDISRLSTARLNLAEQIRSSC
jgi:hypothetical protein